MPATVLEAGCVNMQYSKYLEVSAVLDKDQKRGPKLSLEGGSGQVSVTTAG